MPKVVSLPESAMRAACSTASRKAAAFTMLWSEASVRSSASPCSRTTCSAATASAGAVLRPTGSRICSAPRCLSCSAMMKRCSWLLMTIGAAQPARPSSRPTVSCSRVRSLSRVRNCLGSDLRDMGHNRVPEPPHRITGWMRLLTRYSSDMKIALTGAGGFIGSALRPVLGGHELYKVDAREPRILAGTHAVVHLAAIAHRRASPDELRRVNVELAARVGSASAAAGARMLFLSTLKVHGEQSEAPLSEAAPLAPRDAYARSKAYAEEALRAIPGLRLTVLRPPLVYGAGVKANFLALLRAVARGVPLPLASVTNRRSVLYVGNIAHAIARCLEGAAEGRTYVVSDGAALSSAALCTQLGDALGRPARLFAFPAVLLPRKLRASQIGRAHV